MVKIIEDAFGNHTSDSREPASPMSHVLTFLTRDLHVFRVLDHRPGQDSIRRRGQNHPNINSGMRKKPVSRGGPWVCFIYE